MTKNSMTEERHPEDSQTDDKEILLREYEEIGQCWRHDDQVASQLTAMLLPLSVGAFVLPFAYPSLAALPISLGGILMMLFWLLYYMRLEPRFALRFKRAKEIEHLLGINHHRKFDKPGLQTKAPRITHLRITIFVIYCVIWIVLLKIH